MAAMPQLERRAERTDAMIKRPLLGGRAKHFSISSGPSAGLGLLRCRKTAWLIASNFGNENARRLASL